MEATTPLFTRCSVLDIVPFGHPGHNSSLYALSLSAPQWKTWYPGQFVMVRIVHSDTDTGWARPFAICRMSENRLVVFIQAKGKVTTQMARLKPDDEVEIWGPLGNALAMEPENQTLIIAGGIGIAPFISYIQAHSVPSNLSLLFGHSLPIGCYPFDNIIAKVHAEDFYDAKPGDTAIFSQKVEDRIVSLAKKTNKKGLVLACGPTPLLKKVQETAKKCGVRAQLSLETRMACGIGACLGCVVKTLPEGGEVHQPHHVQTCTCGPNFWSHSVML